MQATPPGWPRVSVSVYYRDPVAAIDWLCRAFQFELRLKVEGEAGEIVHSELTFGEGLFMVAGISHAGHEAEPWQERKLSPLDAGGCTQAACLFVDDADAHCAIARAAGAKIVREPATNDYGDDYWADRSYGALDQEGHLWWFMQRVRTGAKQ